MQSFYWWIGKFFLFLLLYQTLQQLLYIELTKCFYRYYYANVVADMHISDMNKHNLDLNQSQATDRCLEQ